MLMWGINFYKENFMMDESINEKKRLRFGSRFFYLIVLPSLSLKWYSR